MAAWFSLGFVIVLAALSLLVLHEGAAPLVQFDNAAGKLLEAQLEQARFGASAGSPQIFRVSEGALNSIVDARLKPSRTQPTRDGESSLRDVKFNLIEDRLHVYLVLTIYGKDLTVDLEGRIRTENGYIEFDPVSGKIGALPIPQSTLAAAVREIASSPEHREDLRLPRYLKDLRVENGKIVLTYR